LAEFTVAEASTGRRQTAQLPPLITINGGGEHELASNRDVLAFVVFGPALYFMPFHSFAMPVTVYQLSRKGAKLDTVAVTKALQEENHELH